MHAVGLRGRLGDGRHLDVRRASALGMLAHPQRALDLAAGTDPEASTPTALKGFRGTLYLHVSLAGLATTTGGGRVERLGTASLTLLRDWLQRVHGVSVRPVLDPARTDSVDAHDPPAWMRELVILRDRHCVFPGCTVDARSCDLDHLDPYVHLDEGGPPGQTTPAKVLARWCRRHRQARFCGWVWPGGPPSSRGR